MKITKDTLKEYVKEQILERKALVAEALTSQQINLARAASKKQKSAWTSEEGAAMAAIKAERASRAQRAAIRKAPSGPPIASAAGSTVGALPPAADAAPAAASAVAPAAKPAADAETAPAVKPTAAASTEQLTSLTHLPTGDQQSLSVSKQAGLTGFDPEHSAGAKWAERAAQGDPAAFMGAMGSISPKLVLDPDLLGTSKLPAELQTALKASTPEQRLAYAKKQAEAQKAKAAEEKLSTEAINKLKDQESQAKLKNKLGDFFNKLERSDNPKVAEYIKARKAAYAASQFSEEKGGFEGLPYGDIDIEAEDEGSKGRKKTRSQEQAKQNAQAELEALRGDVTYTDQEGKIVSASPTKNAPKWAAAVRKMDIPRRNNLIKRIQKVLSHQKSAGINPKTSREVDVKKTGPAEHGDARRGHEMISNLQTEMAFLLYFNANELEKKKEFKKAFFYQGQALEQLRKSSAMGSIKQRSSLGKHLDNFHKYRQRLKDQYQMKKLGTSAAAGDALQESKKRLIEWWKTSTSKATPSHDDQLMKWWKK